MNANGENGVARKLPNIILSAMRQNTAMVRLSSELKHDMNVRGEYGETGLHWAALTGDEEMAKELLAGGATGAITDNNGNTPEQLAVKYGHRSVAVLIGKYGYARGGRSKDR